MSGKDLILKSFNCRPRSRVFLFFFGRLYLKIMFIECVQMVFFYLADGIEMIKKASDALDSTFAISVIGSLNLIFKGVIR